MRSFEKRTLAASLAVLSAAAAFAQTAQLDMQGSFVTAKGALNFTLCAKKVAYPNTSNIPVLNGMLDPDWVPAPNYGDPNAVPFGNFKGYLPNGAAVNYKLVGARLDIFKREGRILFRWHFSTNIFRFRREGAAEMENAAMTMDVVLGPACPAPKVAYRIFSVSDPGFTLASSSNDPSGPWLAFRGRLAMKGSSGGGN